MWESPLFAIIGSVVGIIAAGVASFMGYFVRQTLGDFRKAQEEFREAQAKTAEKFQESTRKTEARLDSRLTEMANNLNTIELQGLQLKAEVQKDFRSLHEDFIPRREMQEVVKGLRLLADSNAKGIEKLDTKIDRVIEILTNRQVIP